MRKPTVFLITGYARAGKDTAANAIADFLGCDTHAFADKLKDSVNRYFTSLGIEAVNVHETADKVRFRELLVAAGRAARSVDRNVFADHVALDCHLALMRGKCAVVSDWRYANEHERIVAKVGRERVVTIMVNRHACEAANQEEQDSIDEIVARNMVNHSGFFMPGAIASLTDWAIDIANQHATHVPAA
jgi:tRNA uridine 5-carbamoylmethylation protein Kti12